MRLWRRYCGYGWTTIEIARELGLSAKTLSRSVQRERNSGNPDAIVHPLARQQREAGMWRRAAWGSAGRARAERARAERA